MRGFDRLRIVIAVGIFAVWLCATVYDAASSSYAVPNNVQNLMMIVAGFLFTPAVIRAATRRTGGDDDDRA